VQAVFLAALAAASLVHLASLFSGSGRVRAFSKICLAPLILGTYISRAESVFFPVVLALFFGWFGDIMLLKKKDVRFFRLGLAGFLLGHISYTAAMFSFAGPPSPFALAAGLAAALPLGIGARRFIRPSKEMSLPAAAYETAILLMAFSALQLFLVRSLPFGALAFAGSICFLVSDFLLAYFAFHRQPRYGNVPVMVLYIAAQLCLVLGLAGM
jgi:uncharacterized membrane protein YhhN